MKIVIFSDTFPPQVDGVANVAYRSATELAARSHEVHVMTVSSGLRSSKKHKFFLKQNKFNIVRLPAVPALIYSGYRFALPSGIAFDKIRKIKPDIIHTHTPFSIGWQSIWLAKFFGIPLVGTHHTFYNHYLKHAKLDYEWAKKISWKYMVGYYKNCDIVLSPSKSLAYEMKAHGLKKTIKVLPNPVDTDVFRPILDEETKSRYKKSLGIPGKSVVYMGRVSYEKSIDQIIKAMAYVIKKMPETRLVIIGDGPEREKLELLAENLGIKENVIFTKFCFEDDLITHLQANDIFISASKTETFSLAILEGMACGLPIIAVDALAIPEVVKNNVNGFLVPPDKPKIMSEKILELLGDEKLLKKFSLASLKLALSYSQKNVFAKSPEKIYTDLKENK